MPLEPAALLNVRVKITGWAGVWTSTARASMSSAGALLAEAGVLLATERADARGSGSRRSAQGRLRAGRDAGDHAGGAGDKERGEGGGLHLRFVRQPTPREVAGRIKELWA